MSDQNLLVDLSRRFLNLIDHPEPGMPSWHEAVQNIVNEIADVSAKLKRRKTKTNNRRSNHFIEWNGRRQTISQWARETGINKNTLWKRINSGWPTERIFV